MTREVVGQQIRHVVAEAGIGAQIPTQSSHQACWVSSWPWSSLQVSKAYDCRHIPSSARLCVEKRRCQACQASSSLLTVLPESFICRNNRHTIKLKRRNAINEDGDSYVDMQRLPSAVKVAEGKPGNVRYDKVDIFDDDGDRVLEEQFNRFAMAMTTQDSNMAQQIMQEMGYCTVSDIFYVLNVL